MPKFNIESAIYRWRVRGGFIGILLALVLAKPNLTSILIGIAISLFGLLIRTWASGHLRKEKELTILGPYQYTRNPLYLGNLIIGISVVAGSRSWWMLAFFLAYFLIFYPVAIKNEKERMRKLFPQEYKDYKRKVPPFFPSLRPLFSLQKGKFSWKLYKKNKEFRALIGAALFWMLMLGKMFVF